MSEVTQSKPGFKFLWSHQSKVHRLLVRAANRMIGLVPFKVRYWGAIRLKRNKVPYSLILGKTVIQVGAPYDTLEAGRSRGMLFSHLVGIEGRVFTIEPLLESVDRMETRLKQCGLKNTQVVHSGAWSEQKKSYINVDVRHPATNFTDNTVDYTQSRVSQFEKKEIELNTLDNIAQLHGIDDVELVSITTNWAEEEILKGMTELFKSGVKYVSLAYGKNGEFYEETMNDLGYTLLSHDDRGVTFKANVDAS